jgi:hypothetical protein
MAQEEEQAVELYDFLYRDSNRLTSYYSQIFQGKLSSIEELENSKEASQKTGGANLKVISGQYQKTNEDQTSSKRVFDPHDLNTTDVLSFLQTNKYIHIDYENAPNGAMVLVKGKLFFTDRNMLSISAQAALFISQQENPIQEITEEQRLEIQVVQQMLNDGFFQPVCFLQTKDGHIIAGTVKEIGLEELVTTYYLKYGSLGLDDVYIIGLKEVPAFLDEENFSQMIKGMQQLTDSISDFLCGEESIKITPLAIFRKVEPIKKNKVMLGSASRKNKNN